MSLRRSEPICAEVRARRTGTTTDSNARQRPTAIRRPCATYATQEGHEYGLRPLATDDNSGDTAYIARCGCEGFANVGTAKDYIPQSGRQDFGHAAPARSTLSTTALSIHHQLDGVEQSSTLRCRSLRP
ncbi:hypothetical protein K523DRAFT_138981 [Schizophyllum commune Tattone D]|nr:hypothetical protein K523DRAFT_138981 [Schizophyllum commune Tattone D]